MSEKSRKHHLVKTNICPVCGSVYEDECENCLLSENYVLEDDPQNYINLILEEVV